MTMEQKEKLAAGATILALGAIGIVARYLWNLGDVHFWLPVTVGAIVAVVSFVMGRGRQERARLNLPLLIWRLFHVHKWSVWCNTTGTLAKLGWGAYQECTRIHGPSGEGCGAYRLRRE